MKLKLTSKSRWNGGIAIKRSFGSSTITEFWVEVDGKLQDWTVNGYGATPGNRMTYAKEKAAAKLAQA